MRRALLTAWTLAGLVLVSFLGCAEEENPADVKIRAHPAEWTDPASADFHGIRVLNSGGAETCTTCHGEALLGDGQTVGCDDCHAGAGGHPFGYANSENDRFHGDDVAAYGPTVCADCHGSDFRGGWTEVSCFTCHAGGPSGHPDAWMNPDVHTFHGREVFRNGLTDCRRCHGNDFLGGTSGVACRDCHIP